MAEEKKLLVRPAEAAADAVGQLHVYLRPDCNRRNFD
jgi:hypothetical protein